MVKNSGRFLWWMGFTIVKFHHFPKQNEFVCIVGHKKWVLCHVLKWSDITKNRQGITAAVITTHHEIALRFRLKLGSVHIWRQQPRGFRNADGCWQGGGKGSKPCWRQQKYLNFGKNCSKSSVPITMRETTALIYSPKLMTTFSFKLDKINI